MEATSFILEVTLACSSTDFLQNVGYIDLVCATISYIHLNATALFNPNLLILTLILFLVCKSDHIQNLTFHVIVNFSFTY